MNAWRAYKLVDGFNRTQRNVPLRERVEFEALNVVATWRRNQFQWDRRQARRSNPFLLRRELDWIWVKLLLWIQGIRAVGSLSVGVLVVLIGIVLARFGFSAEYFVYLLGCVGIGVWIKYEQMRLHEMIRRTRAIV